MKHHISFFIILTFLAAGCSTFKPQLKEPFDTAGSPEAKALFQLLASRNAALRSFKGTGRMQMKDERGIQHARLMWAGYHNEKLRLEIMGNAGQPVFSFAGDGKRIYLISHTENRYYSQRNTHPDLKKLISLNIRVSECLDLLAGRVPTERRLLPMSVQDQKNDERILVLKRGESSAFMHILIDAPSGDVRRIEAYDEDGDLDYRAEFVHLQRVSGFEVPRELRLSNGGQTSLQIVVERFWPNAEVSEGLFELSKPD